MSVEEEEESLLKILAHMVEDEKWLGEPSELHNPLSSVLNAPPSTAAEASSSSSSSSAQPRPLRILFPGCCNSQRPEDLYDAGFHHITCIDVSKPFIYEMIERNMNLRPDMKCRVMNMTRMHKFGDETFDIVIDYGRLDFLIAHPVLASLYMLEVKRVLQKGGKFICLTLGTERVLEDMDLLVALVSGKVFPKFRYGWRLSVDALPNTRKKQRNIQTFMVIAEKESSFSLDMISLSFDPDKLPPVLVRGLVNARETENEIRKEFSNSSDILYTLEDPQRVVKGDLTKLCPGQRIQFTMGEDGSTRFVYRAVLLDSDRVLYPVKFRLVAKTRGHEWLYSSEEGQRIVAEKSKASRLIMVLVDSTDTERDLPEIKKDLSPLVRKLVPWWKNVDIIFSAGNDGVKERKLIHQITSPVTGPIAIDEVVYMKSPDNSFLPTWDTYEELLFRRLTFPSCQNLVQSQVFLRKEEPKKDARKKEWKQGNRGKSKSDATPIGDSSNGPTMVYDYLVNPYHIGIVSGFVLISVHLEKMVASTGHSVRAAIIGLGGGVLPMFLLRCLPVAQIEVVELDPDILKLAKAYFGFKEGERLKVHVADGVQYVKGIATSIELADTTAIGEPGDGSSIACPSVSCESSLQPGKECSKVDILIVDVDSFDPSSGMVCPAAEFVEESFLSFAKESISQHGMLIIHLLSRSAGKKNLAMSRLKRVFSKVYSFPIEENIEYIIFALNEEASSGTEAPERLMKLFNVNHPLTARRIESCMKAINALK